MQRESKLYSAPVFLPFLSSGSWRLGIIIVRFVLFLCHLFWRDISGRVAFAPALSQIVLYLLLLLLLALVPCAPQRRQKLNNGVFYYHFISFDGMLKIYMTSLNFYFHDFRRINTVGGVEGGCVCDEMRVRWITQKKKNKNGTYPPYSTPLPWYIENELKQSHYIHVWHANTLNMNIHAIRPNTVNSFLKSKSDAIR